MKKRLLALLLFTLSCGTVGAGWVKLSDTPKSVIYMDSDVSKKVGNNVMVWLLRDHTSPRIGESGRYLSSKDQLEVDCRERRIRRIYSSDHPGHMGEGDFIHSEHGPMSWNTASPNTVISRVVDVACSGR